MLYDLATDDIRFARATLSLQVGGLSNDACQSGRALDFDGAHFPQTLPTLRRYENVPEHGHTFMQLCPISSLPTTLARSPG